MTCNKTIVLLVFQRDIAHIASNCKKNKSGHGHTISPVLRRKIKKEVTYKKKLLIVSEICYDRSESF